MANTHIAKTHPASVHVTNQEKWNKTEDLGVLATLPPLATGPAPENQDHPRVVLVNRIVDAIRSLNAPPFEFLVSPVVTPKLSVVTAMVREVGCSDQLTVGVTEELKVTFDGWKRGRRLEIVVRAISAIHSNMENPFWSKPMATPSDAGSAGQMAKLTALGPEGVARSMALMREARWKPFHDAIESVIQAAEVTKYAETLTVELENAGVQPHQQKAALKRICDVIINYRRA